MKKTSILICICIFLISANLKLHGQEDSVIIENSTEPYKNSDLKLKRKYKYLDNNFREEKTLLKIGITPVSNMLYSYDLERFWENFDINLSFEKKINTAFSVHNDYGFRHDPHDESGMKGRFYSDIGFRYYYSMNKRIKKANGVNNFHGNYFSLKLEELATYGNLIDVVESDSIQLIVVGNNDWRFKPYICLSWGMQRRIGKYGYVDVSPNIKFNRTNFGFGVNLFIGFGLGFKN
jgi:hypothetical protein